MADAIAHPNVFEERISAKFVLGGAIAETMIGVGALVLSIVGLAGFMPIKLLSIATIGLGASFIFEGGAVATRFTHLLSETTEGRLDIAELGGGLSAEFIAGLGGITLGILSLVNVMPAVLTAVAAIMYGGTLVVGVGVKNRLNALRIGQEEHKIAQEIARQAVLASSGVQILTGLGAVVLGILALLKIEPTILSLVAILSVSGAMVLGSTTIGSRMLSIFRY